MKTVLLDGDIILFQVSASLNKSYDFGDEVMTSCDLEEMKRRVHSDIRSIMDLVGVTKYLFVLSGSNNFRKKYFPTYKMNRKGTEKPDGYYELKEWCLDTLVCRIEDDLEADDVMAAMGSQHPEKYIIFSRDKDLKTAQCEQWDFKAMQLWTPTKFQALHYLYYQVLMGDSTDGYCGLEGCGPIKAEKILKDCKGEKDLLLATLSAYFEYYGYSWVTVDRFQYQIGQARILYAADIKALREDGETYNPFKYILKEASNG